MIPTIVHTSDRRIDAETLAGRPAGEEVKISLLETELISDFVSVYSPDVSGVDPSSRVILFVGRGELRDVLVCIKGLETSEPQANREAPCTREQVNQGQFFLQCSHLKTDTRGIDRPLRAAHAVEHTFELLLAL
jgi:hypothetical protein